MEEQERQKPRAAVSIERKVNMGNYESAAVFMSISDLTADTTDEEINEVIETQARAYEVLKGRVREEVSRIRPQASARKSA
jgi:hypothetical protein